MTLTVLQIAVLGSSILLVGMLLGAICALANRDAFLKIITDTCKDDLGSWDMARIAGNFGLLVFFAGLGNAIALRPGDFLANAVAIATSIGVAISGYALAVVGHSYAKK